MLLTNSQVMDAEAEVLIGLHFEKQDSSQVSYWHYLKKGFLQSLGVGYKGLRLGTSAYQPLPWPYGRTWICDAKC